MKSLKDANEFVHEQQNKDTFNRPRYHFTAPVGWINDPNGFSFFGGKYHLFYQYEPYHQTPETMFWGHATSSDLIVWKNEPIAIAPDRPYDEAGVWSGSAIEKDGRLYAIYTGVSIRDDGTMRQTQNIAISDDGIHFQKYENNPVITNDAIQSFTSSIDFRDPYIIRREKDFLVLVGTHNQKEAMLVSFTTTDLLHYQYAGIVTRSSELGTMFECPTYLDCGNASAVIVSPQNLPPKDHAFWNISSSIYFLMNVMISQNDKKIAEANEIDGGTDFYAPQILKVQKNSTMIAWMQMWGRRYYLPEKQSLWTNALTLPRKVTLKNGRLFQKPHPEIKKYFANPVTHRVHLQGAVTFSDIVGNSLALHIAFSPADHFEFEVRLLKQGNHYISLTYTHSKKMLLMDRRNSGVDLFGHENEKARDGYRYLPVQLRQGQLVLDIFLDVISVEVFVNHGEKTMTMLAYSGGNEIEFLTNIKTRVLVQKKDIVL